MRILIDINHPADVHQFRRMISNLESKGHHILVTARDKDVTYELLKAFDISFIKRKGYTGIFGKTMGLIMIDFFLLRTALKFKPDILIGSSGNCYITQVSWIIGKPSVLFSDTEFASLQNKITFPFATKICTPSCFYEELGDKQVRYNGYKELAYLHPKYFRPKKSKEKYAIVRLVSFQASHDIGYRGIADAGTLVSALEKRIRVYISSEKPLGADLKKYELKARPEEIHSILANAQLFIGDSSTMAAEAAVLGVPSIFISDSKRGYTEDLSEKYGLILKFSTSEAASAVKAGLALLGKQKEWAEKRKQMLAEKIDVTEWMTNFIEDQKNWH